VLRHAEEIPLPAQASIGSNGAEGRAEDLQPGHFVLEFGGASHEVQAAAAGLLLCHSFAQ
jgi:hypothetical protein